MAQYIGDINGDVYVFILFMGSVQSDVRFVGSVRLFLMNDSPLVGFMRKLWGASLEGGGALIKRLARIDLNPV